MPSRTADEIIATAQECYSLDLISERKLEYVIHRAETEPDYNPVSDLPFSWEIDHERSLRRAAARKGWLRRLLRRFS